MPAKAKSAKAKPKAPAKAKVTTKAAAKPAKKAVAKAPAKKRVAKKPATKKSAAKKPAAKKLAVKKPAMKQTPAAATPAPAPREAPASAPIPTPDVMPAFSMAGSDGSTWDNATLAGKTYVLYFYPKDSTPGCTVEACDFRDNLARLQSIGVTVLGVSPDSLASHASFIAKENLNFPLLVDENHALAEALGSWVKKSMYGREYMGIDRSTFLVDGTGRIRKAWRSVKVTGHVDEVIAAANSLAVVAEG